MNNLAPIILFVYNRPQHTLQTLEALSKNELAQDSILYIFADGIKKNASDETIAKINETRTIIKSKPWCKEVHVIERTENFGLAKSVIEGVTQIINQYGKVIVLEDDLVTSPYFLQFMNDALAKYENESSVACISAYIYPAKQLPELFFIKGADCWGWATWKKAWNVFEPDGTKLLHELCHKKLEHQFDFQGTYPYTQMLRDQIAHKNDSWAIRWYASCFLKNMLCLYPGKSLITNIGLDGSGVHSGVSKNYKSALTTHAVAVKDIPVEENTIALQSIKNYFASIIEPQKKLSMISKIYQTLIPGALRQKIYYIRHPKTKPNYGWFGNYKTWEAAEAECSGYDGAEILQKVKNAILKVKSGEATYERDSVLFDELQYSEPLLNTFIHCIEQKHLHITDFGGSLGSTYFQYRTLLPNDIELKWAVIEQKHFVECGKTDIEEEHLHFFNTIEEVLLQQKNQVLLLSSVLPYFKEPYALIEKLTSYGYEHIIIDRTAFIESEHERITKQIVPPFIYTASYPAWFFNENKFIQAFSNKYNLIESFDSNSDPTENLEDGVTVYRKGFYFKLKK